MDHANTLFALKDEYDLCYKVDCQEAGTLSISVLTVDVYFGNSKAAKRLRGCYFMANLRSHSCSSWQGMLAADKDRSPLCLAHCSSPLVFAEFSLWVTHWS